MRTWAGFRLIGEVGCSGAVTNLLGIAPTKSREIGDPISRGNQKPRDEWMWLLRSTPNPTNEELSNHLNTLLDILEPVADELWSLERLGMWANWFCLIESNPLEHAVEIDRPLLRRLLSVPGELWLDCAGDDEPEWNETRKQLNARSAIEE